MMKLFFINRILKKLLPEMEKRESGLNLEVIKLINTVMNSKKLKQKYNSLIIQMIQYYQSHENNFTVVHKEALQRLINA